jgi:hypothetical protein
MRSWHQRAKITDATYAAGKGVPLEHMILLCNFQKASPWFTMPHMANDDYVIRFANYVKDYLDPSLDIYIEYSNEVWNSIFEQHKYAVNMGRKMSLSENDFQAYARFYSQRSIEIFRIWEKVFENRKRLKFILAGQIGNNWLTKEILEWKRAYKTADAYAVAPYFGGKYAFEGYVKKAKEMSLSEFEKALSTDIREVTEKVRLHSEFLKSYGMPVYAYEAGQHLVGAYGSENDELLNRMFDKINRDKAMKRLYLLYLELWKENGGGILMIFSSIAKQSKWGRWGMAEDMYIGRDKSPKWDAVLEFIQSE